MKVICKLGLRLVVIGLLSAIVIVSRAKTAAAEGAQNNPSLTAKQNPNNGRAVQKNGTSSSISAAESRHNGVPLLPVEENLLYYTNLERQRYGLPLLIVDQLLQESSRRHCRWMAQVGSLVHTSEPVAENIAMGQPSSKKAVESWMRSPGHRYNILNPRHRRVGVAAYQSPNGPIYWCQQFLP